MLTGQKRNAQTVDNGVLSQSPITPKKVRFNESVMVSTPCYRSTPTLDTGTSLAVNEVGEFDQNDNNTASPCASNSDCQRSAPSDVPDRSPSASTESVLDSSNQDNSTTGPTSASPPRAFTDTMMAQNDVNSSKDPLVSKGLARVIIKLRDEHELKWSSIVTSLNAFLISTCEEPTITQGNVYSAYVRSKQHDPQTSSLDAQHEHDQECIIEQGIFLLPLTNAKRKIEITPLSDEMKKAFENGELKAVDYINTIIHDDGVIEKTPWSANDDAELKRIQEEMKESFWKHVCEKLYNVTGTKRSEVECRDRLAVIQNIT